MLDNRSISEIRLKTRELDRRLTHTMGTVE